MPDPDYLSLTDSELLAQCEVDTYRASGPGGQKRNKTESAVRLRHGPTSVSTTATESRSQHENKARALKRLRERIALDVRGPAIDVDDYCCPPDLSGLLSRGGERIGKKNPAYLPALRALFDLFVACDCSMRDTAQRIGVTTGALSRFVTGEDSVRRKANELRAERGLKPLR